MINFNHVSSDEPYVRFKKEYDKAVNANQKNIEAISISSYSSILNEVNSRFVNLKIIEDKNFIFFSNYHSQKSDEFKNHNQISALVFWNNTNIQIRLKCFIKKTTKAYNRKYFVSRDEGKNALAISSNQSKIIDSFKTIEENYMKSLKSDNLKKCPDHWGGYSLTPYYFEFWEGHESRLNKREVYELKDGNWSYYLLQP